MASRPSDIFWTGGVFFLALIYLIVRVPEALSVLYNNDQAYQMVLGMAVAKGRLPGFDFITQYGPAVAFSSFLSFAMTGSAIGEMAMSVLGYSSTVAIGFNVVRRTTGHYPALLAALAMLIWFPRFYKWYYSLFPLLGIVVARSYYIFQADRRPTRLIVSLWAQLVGISAMFRYDLGLEGIIFGTLAIVASHDPIWHRRPSNLPRDLISFFAGSLLIPATYVAAIGLMRGPAQGFMFLHSIYDGAVDSVEAYGIPPFGFRFAGGLGPYNALALLQVVLPVTYSICGVAGFLGLRADQKETRYSGFILLCVSLVGLGVYPQSIHRADLQHLLQVVYPFIIDTVLLASSFRKADIVASYAAGTVGVIALIVSTSSAIELLPGLGKDLGPVSLGFFSRWQALANLPYSEHNDPVADMATAVRQLTPPNARIFLAMATTNMPLLFFAQRYQPGIFPVYEPGMFSGQFWLQRNRLALASSPPDFLLVCRTDPDPNPAPFMADLVQAWRSEYTNLLYRNEIFDLLARP